MSQAREILEGVYNKMIRSEDVEIIANERMKQCDTCEFKVEKPIKKCGKCGCVLSLKTRSIKSNCPIGKWKEIEEQARNS